MEKEDTRSSGDWTPGVHKVRLYSFQRYTASHEKEVRNTSATCKKGETAPARGRSSTIAAEARGHSVERRHTVSEGVAEDAFAEGDQQGDVPESDDEAEAIVAMRATKAIIHSWADSKTKWDEGKKKADLYDLPLMSPATLPPARQVARKRHKSLMKSRTSSADFTADGVLTDRGAGSEVKDDPYHDSELHSEPEPTESSEDEVYPKPRLTNVPNEGDNRQGHIEQMKRYAEDIHQLNLDPEDKDRDHDSRLQSPDSGDALSNDNQVIIKDFGSWNPSNKQESDHDLLPQSLGSDHSIDETSDRENQAVSDMGQKPDQTGTSSKTLHASHSNERDSLGSQTQPSGSEPTLVDISSIHDAVERQIDLDINETKAPDTTHPPGSSQPKSSGSMENASRNSHLKSPGSDHTKSAGSQPTSPVRGGAIVERSSTQDQSGENFDREIWLNSDAPLQGNYKAIPRDAPSPESISPNYSSNPSSRTDSLVISPTIPDGQQSLGHEESPSASTANADIVNFLAKYKANFPLMPPSGEQAVEDERESKAATDGQNGSSQAMNPQRSGTSSPNTEDSLLLSSGPGHESPVKSDLEKAKEKEASQAALEIFELYSANYQMQKDLEEKEAKFKREIQIAWTHPRPPPTTREQKSDKLALERIESKEIFDELGEQQRPVRTDPRWVLHETEVNMLLTRAQINYILEDYPKMYSHANHAAVAAGPLKFAPLTARCCYYRGMASYYYRAFTEAKDDFLESRGCAGRYGILSENIERFIDSIDKADDPETAVLVRVPARKFTEVRTFKQRRRARSTNVDNKNEPLPSTADDATTLVGGSPRSPEDRAMGLAPFSSANEEKHSAGPSRGDANAQSQTLHRPDHLGGFPLDGDPQPGTEDVPNYKPQEEAISEEIRKDIFESKAQSLNPVSEAGPTEANPQARVTLSPPSMASTERTLLGSNTTQETTRRVPRPHVAPITTSFATARNNTAREASAEATPASGYTDEGNSAEIYAAFGGKPREDATPNSAESSNVSNFGW
ncbi:hypothetical protein HO173_010827 [Letharia columbiana]|uniref:Uncharacterized protein n=1 Tax=Letharia columbiana TaxID=112416 RepID=A0A8H6FLU9_9LECA|nr:uncharacterized protein HO173_010827 [Letharia columbiana]KAF6230919.1 hypothetical protein HO173_010827 [Letharia columbiana]